MIQVIQVINLFSCFFIPEELAQQMDLQFDLALILHRMPLLMQTLPFIREWDQGVH